MLTDCFELMAKNFSLGLNCLSAGCCHQLRSYCVCLFFSPLSSTTCVVCRTLRRHRPLTTLSVITICRIFRGSSTSESSLIPSGTSVWQIKLRGGSLFLLFMHTSYACENIWVNHWKQMLLYQSHLFLNNQIELVKVWEMVTEKTRGHWTNGLETVRFVWCSSTAW